MSTNRPGPFTWYPCDCSDPSHYLRLWVDPVEGGDWNESIELCMGFPYLTPRQRLRVLWNLVRGHYGYFGFVSLHRQDAIRLRNELGLYITRSRNREAARQESWPRETA